MADLVRSRHRRSFRFIKTSKKENALIPPWGTRTEIASAVPPCLPETRPPHDSANTPSAFNAGNTSADTQVFPFPVPSAAHLLLRFSLRSQPPELSVDALATLLPLRWFHMDLLHLTIDSSVCQELFSATGGMGCQSAEFMIR